VRDEHAATRVKTARSARYALAVALAGALLALLVPLTGAAGAVGTQAAAASAPATFVDPLLLSAAKTSPSTTFSVIVQSSLGLSDAVGAVTGALGGTTSGTVGQQYSMLGALSATMSGTRLTKLATTSGRTITPDTPVRMDGAMNYSNVQLWPYGVGIAHVWDTSWGPQLPTPTIAIVDSGVDASRPDLANQLKIPQVNLTSLTPNAPGDGRGHGTFVASLAAGVGASHIGAAPNGKLISLDVMDDHGMAMTRDVIAAAQWIYDNRYRYNIGVANFSLHSTVPSHFVVDPLDKAVEKLWLNGVVVVAAAGNYGVGGASTNVLYAPANDPFVITVGAVDNKGTLSRGDDVAAPWSTWGYTPDGFSKPELSAPGRYMIGAVPPSSTLATERGANVVSPGYMQLSGTSFAAPVVAGAAAQLLAQRPGLKPDDVKALLMLGADNTTAATKQSLGAGELDVGKSVALAAAGANPNAGLLPFVKVNWAVNDTAYFDGDAWETTVAGSKTWDDVAWDAKYWGNASWDAKYWGTVSWDAKYWGTASVADSAWSSQSASDVSREAAAEGDKNSTGYPLSAADKAALASDPYRSLP
jgi:subtilisin family serine protease